MVWKVSADNKTNQYPNVLSQTFLQVLWEVRAAQGNQDHRHCRRPSRTHSVSNQKSALTLLQDLGEVLAAHGATREVSMEIKIIVTVVVRVGHIQFGIIFRKVAIVFISTIVVTGVPRVSLASGLAKKIAANDCVEIRHAR